MLGYHIGVYAKRCMYLSSKKTNDKQMGNADGEGNKSAEEEGCYCNALNTGGKPRRSQDDSSILIKMEKTMDGLLMVFEDIALVALKTTNHWRMETLEAL